MVLNPRKLCSVRMLHKRIPITSWLPRYSLEDGLSDLVAGVTVGLTLMPQAIAYAALAGLGPQYGLYSAFAGSFVYIFFGTCKEVNIGPTALMSLLTLDYTHGTSPDMAVLLCFLSGIVQLLCGVLRLGFLVEFVSIPVVSAFTSAAAVIIATSQLKGLLGLQVHADSFLDTWYQLAMHIGDTRLWDLVLGSVCITTLLILRKLKDVKFGPENKKTTRERVLTKLCWLISTGRNAMVVVTCAALAYSLDSMGEAPFLLTGKIVPGLPEINVPPFSTSYGNQTHSFLDMCAHLGSGILVVPIIGILGNVAIAKAFSNGEMLDATQEILTLGLCSVVGSFVRSIPVTGSFSRSAVNNASGVRTPMGGLYTGILVILALSLLTPYFYFIPRATLSSVIICAVLFMVEVQTLIDIWLSSKRDLISAVVTFIACLGFGVVVGILIGVAIDLLFLLYFNARPEIKTEKVQCATGGEYLLITPRSSLLFPSVDFLRATVTKVHTTTSGVMVVDCAHVQRVDFTSAQGLASLLRDARAKGVHVVFLNPSPGVTSVLESVLGNKLVVSESKEELMETIRGLQNGVDMTPSKAEARIGITEENTTNHVVAPSNDTTKL